MDVDVVATRPVLRYMVRDSHTETLDGRCIVVADDVLVTQAHTQDGDFYLTCCRHHCRTCEHVMAVVEYRRAAHLTGGNE